MIKDELKEAIRQLELLPDNDDIWTGHRKTLRSEILHNDIDNFLRWAVIQATMFVANAPYIQDEYNEVTLYFDKGIIAEPKLGNPNLWDNWTSGNLIHQAYHIKQWMDRTGLKVENLDQIVEVGGGYGAMCLVAKKLCHPDTQYTIVDLPEFSLLQEYYLSNTIGLNGIDFTQDVSKLCDLLIASHSLSEMSIEAREWILENIKPQSYLFIFHCDFDGVDNIEYFRDFANKNPEYQWWQWMTPHFTNQYYQVGLLK